LLKVTDSNQTNMNSTIKKATKVVEELNQSNKYSDRKRKAFDTEKQDLRFLKEKSRKASNA